MSVATCIRCEQEKSVKEFNKRSSTMNGLNYYCRKCSKEVSNKYRTENKDKVNQLARERYDYSADYAKKIRRKFNLTSEEYNLFVKDGSCKICGKQQSDKHHKRLSFDHCHKTGKLRGLLCNKHNKALGLFDDNIEFLSKAIEYLKQNE